jgi:uncharacterized radical SAM superfamily Fe-S cluster-containing enzyme
MIRDVEFASEVSGLGISNGNTKLGSGEGEIEAEESTSICPECRKLIDCRIIFRKNKVFIRKVCDIHGNFEVEIYSNAEDYVKARKFSKPGAKPLHYQGKVAQGCPDDCGLCPAHEQHTCVGVIEITDICNLKCPVCFADTEGSFSLPLERVKDMIDLYLKCEGIPEILQISGGEPTIHPNIIEILEYVGQKGIQYPLLNTNGIKLADRDFTKKISKTMESNGPIIYLQFDGFSDDIYMMLRGSPLLNVKMKAIENCKEFDMNVTLVPTIVKGINDHEIGKIVEFASGDNNLKAVNFQLVSTVGRHRLGNKNGRMSIPEFLENLESQTDGLLKKQNFINVPCPHPICSMCTYICKKDDDVLTLTEFMDVEDYMEEMVNRTLPDRKLIPEIYGALDSLFSMSATMGTEKTEDALCVGCGIAMPKIKEMVDNITMISVHHFMDQHNFDMKRAKKCCVTEILPDGNMIPFCVYNNLRRKDLKSKFSKMC